VRLATGRGDATREVRLPLSEIDAHEADVRLARAIGLLGPLTQPVMGDIVPGGAADRAGLRTGDRVLSAGTQAIIRAQASGSQGITSEWLVLRDGRELALRVPPDVVADRNGGGARIGRIGAFVGSAPEMVQVQRGPFEGLWLGVERTWDMSALTLRMMGRMIVGEASINNLSGPLTIADFAGKSASLGLTQYLLFLAMISVSLGVLNLLPLPVLDGGHLMYYLWEALSGRSVSEAWMDRLQRGGVVILVLLMSVALFNDVTRLFG